MRFHNLQVGRIVAAAGVLVFHTAYYGEYVLGVPNPLAGPVAAYWFRTAVVYFFALSGFVLAHALQRGTLGGFLGLRLLRLYPPFWAAVAAVIAVRAATGTEFPFTAKSLRELLALWPDGGRQAAVLHVEWTLVYEAFFSLAVVPLAALGRRRGLAVGAGVWLALCLGKQVLAPVTEPPWHPRWAELALSVVNAPFLLGVVLYFVRDRLGAVRGAVPVVAVLTLTAGAAVLGTANTWSYVLQSAGSALAVAYWATGRQVDPDGALVRAGDWAYGVYLLHVPVLLIFFTLSARHGWLPAAGPTVLFGGALAFAVSAGYGAVEWAAYRRVRGWLVGARPVAAVRQNPDREGGAPAVN